MPGETRRHLMAMIAAASMLVLLVLAMVSAITVAADGQPAGDTPDGKNQYQSEPCVLEGLDATRFAQPPPLSPPPGIIGGYYPFHTASRFLPRHRPRRPRHPFPVPRATMAICGTDDEPGTFHLQRTLLTGDALYPVCNCPV